MKYLLDSFEILLVVWALIVLSGCGKDTAIPALPTVSDNIPASSTPTDTNNVVIVASPTEETTPVTTPTPEPTASSTPTPGPTSTPNPEPTATPSPTPTPVPPESAGCQLVSSGSVTSAFNQFINAYTGQSIAVTVKGTLTCQNGNPSVWSLFAWEISTYCVHSRLLGQQKCTLTMQNLIDNSDDTISVQVKTDNLQGYVITPTRELIPSSYYQ